MCCDVQGDPSTCSLERRGMEFAESPAARVAKFVREAKHPKPICISWSWAPIPDPALDEEITEMLTGTVYPDLLLLNQGAFLSA